MRHHISAAWVTGLCVAAAGAQTIARKEPVHYAGRERASRVEARPPGIRLGLRQAREFALHPLSASELARLAEPDVRLRTGIQRTLPSDILSTGAWETTPEGVRVWRLAIRSPGSRGIRVEFRNFSVGGGKVWLDDGTQVAGPYTGRGLFDDGRFWSATVFSESVTLEYEPGPETPAEFAPPFEIATISHRARVTPLDTADPTPGTRDPADYCELDPNCYTDWQSTMKMVAQISFEDAGIGYLCSGALIATRDNSFKPYLLTAGHCINNENAARTLEAYWTYQTSACGGHPPASRQSSEKSTLGAHLIASGTLAEGDYSLVLLHDVPNDVTFAGWDTADPPAGTQLVGLHHPSGSWKRISFGERTDDETNLVGDAAAPGNLYLQILWDQGRIEHGSSGSPLFSGPGVIVGSASYAPVSPDLSACQIGPSVAGYSRFSNTYQNLKDYLEDLPAALVTPDKADISFTVSNHAASPGQVVRITTQSNGQIAFKLRADAPWIGLSTVSGSLSANTPAQAAIAVDPSQLDQPGQYAGTVTILSGAAPPQFINVTVTVRLDESNVAATISPNPIHPSKGQWSFQIRLAETGGAATRVTTMKVDGTDYSSSIKSWFGADHIDANGAIAAPLQANGVFPSGDRYFEFWGVDDLSGQPWYRVAVATFQ